MAVCRVDNRGAVEGRVDEAIRRAIRERRLVEFVLHGLHRVGEPHVYGIRGGAEQLLIYQVGGQSKSGRLPNWRTVLVGEVTGLSVLERGFDASRLPANGDGSWEQVFEKTVP